MMPWLDGPESGPGFANPHSAHRIGRGASAAIEVARGQVGELLPQGGRIVFTSGATEAINMALRGVLAGQMPRRQIVTIATEHAAVRDCCFWLERQGYEVVLLPVDGDGIVDLSVARQAIGDNTAIVAAMLVNNEIGVVQPIDRLAALAHDSGALFLCDAVQGYGRIAIPGSADMIAISAHKIFGPKGIGALWLRDGIEIEPLIFGGGQEQGLRSGTLSPALCAGFGAAAALALERFESDDAHVQSLWNAATKAFSEWVINGATEQRYKGNLNVRRAGLDVARLMADVRNVAFSAGSACASGSGRPSHVLDALGLEDSEIKSSIRLGFGRYTSHADIDQAARLLIDAADRQ